MKKLWRAALLLALVFVLPAGARAAELSDWETTEWQEPIYYETPYLEKNSFYLAKGGSGEKIAVQNGMLSYVSSANPAVATVDPDGWVRPQEIGMTEITVVVVDSQGITSTFFAYVYVDVYQLSHSRVSICLNQGNDALLTLERTMENYGTPEISCSVEDESVAYAYRDWNDDIIVYGQKPGRTKLIVTVGGVNLECEIEVTAVAINKSSVQTYPGKKFTLKLKGTEDKVIWESSDDQIASVSSKGVVKAKKPGTACITAKTDQMELRCYVSVAAKKAVLALKKAQSVLGAAYSQEKRMQKGYYDCSSLIWRSYSPYGVTLGNPTWAPTAADQGRWCAQNKKVIAKKAIKTESLKLRPGDLIFYNRPEKNGRYKDIYHVAMFVGYEAYTDWFGESRLVGIIIDADGNQVSMRSYIEDYGHGKKIVLIARPY